ncbi:hypothetical protein FOQG_17319 [Fusarium oxysporum f. sp. raphani 54005]|uniref:Uncharacterized protein n=2 Tax=Fusarium oxysporum f. sp. raphani TaxID=96318 RepID=X0B774_FUSOX|nr:hypothetical protein FOQG_17319 [Fusarium oxysporum f. sp. raphani 54005]KAG7410419.1 hypothetical protein Forpi1262_v017589 [Fusarium oxysporum f. sp. raphani]KAI3571946.1 hypothetical protein IWW34DRAFT_235427 [Fusarium oxysporum f. sp. albedinis]KAG7413215.1 hypothetical protein Forpi1262_v017256 [Fusarium oxysporum f. sp. raphani]KAJ0130540.1 Uncharacterized protein HZ326_26357 [Fusarium oxysporum f. sp. albedinis]
MDPTPENLSEIKKRISEIMADVAEEQQELDAIVLFIDNIEQQNQDQMSQSASSAKRRRKKAAAMSLEEEKKDYERRRAAKQDSLGRLWQKIHDLQEQERELLKKNL